MSYINFLNVNNIGKGNSFFHKLNPVDKFLFLIVNYIVLFSNSVLVMVVYTAFLLSLLIYSSFGIKRLLMIFIYLLIPLSGFVLLIFLLDIDNKFNMIFLVLLRITAMFLPLLFYSFTTTLRETNYVLYLFLKPLDKIGINTNLINLTLSIVVSYIPILFIQFDNVFLIKASKGEDIKRVGLVKKIKIIYDSIFIILVNSFLSSEQLIEAIIVRGFNKNGTRSFYMKYKMNQKDYFFICVVILELIINYVVI